VILAPVQSSHFTITVGKAAGTIFLTRIRIAIQTLRPESAFAVFFGLVDAVVVLQAASSQQREARIRIARNTVVHEGPAVAAAMVRTVDFAVSVVIAARTKVHAAIGVAIELLQPVDAVALVLRNIDATAAFETAGPRWLGAGVRVANRAGSPGLSVGKQTVDRENVLASSILKAAGLGLRARIRIANRAGSQGLPTGNHTAVRENVPARTIHEAACTRFHW
jgi:hypothetical protein